MADYESIESSQRQHHNEINQEISRRLLETEGQYKRFQMLRPKLIRDGNSWCCLYGDDIQSGIVGYGDTPHDAVLDWELSWHKF